MFRFNAGALVRCTEQKQPGLWYPGKFCSSYIPTCDYDSRPGKSRTLVCFAYPFARDDYCMYEAATFSVTEITEAATEKECLAHSPDWTHDPPENGEPVTINHAKFQLFHTSDLGTTHVFEGREYRTFHEGKCYELSVRSTGSNLRADDAPTGQPGNDCEPDAPLEQALNSFIFLK